MKNEDLMKMQKVQAEMLEVFHNFCEENNIHYQLFGGSLLGAVRHKGFIPWDDDVDVVMLRSEYEKFLKLAGRKINKKYFVQNYKTDSQFNHQFTRLRKDNTLMLQDGLKNLDIHHGIFIDIFPLDVFPKNKKSQKKYIRNLRLHMKIRAAFNPTEAKFNNVISKFANLTFFNVVRLFDKKWLYDKSEKSRKKYNDEKDPIYGHFSLGPEIKVYKRYLHKEDVYKNSKLFEFEHIKAYGPIEYDQVLSKAFNDYMSYPPKEEQVGHHGIIDFKVNSEFERGRK